MSLPGLPGVMPHTSGLTIEMCFLTVLEAGSPRLRCRQGWFLLRSPSGTSGTLSMDSLSLFSVLATLLSLPSYEDINHFGTEHHQMISI
jgi:hypothetical protein